MVRVPKLHPGAASPETVWDAQRRSMVGANSLVERDYRGKEPVMPSQTEAQLYHAYIIATVDLIFAALDGLSDDDLNWAPPAPATNSLSALATHMLGSLQETFVYQLGGQPLDRDRDAEFDASGVSADELRNRWEQRKAEIAAVMTQLASDALDKEYTRPRTGQVRTGRAMLLTAAIHAGEHAGHAELTRDLVQARG
jgi:hypothetical protein